MIPYFVHVCLMMWIWCFRLFICLFIYYYYHISKRRIQLYSCLRIIFFYKIKIKIPCQYLNFNIIMVFLSLFEQEWGGKNRLKGLHWYGTQINITVSAYNSFYKEIDWKKNLFSKNRTRPHFFNRSFAF